MLQPRGMCSLNDRSFIIAISCTAPTLRFGVVAQWAREQWETCEAYLDYVGAIQMYNRYHAKFRRRLSPWLQVPYSFVDIPT